MKGRLMLDISLKGILAQIDQGNIVLPAMQRPFVWQEERIARLIDSLLRGFPLGSVMMWRTNKIQRYRKFQKDETSNAAITIDFETNKSNEFYTVLDGQQRLTALYIAISGTYDSKKLYLNVLSGEKGEKDPGATYWDCRFLSQSDVDGLNNPEAEQNDNLPPAYFLPFGCLANIPMRSVYEEIASCAKKLDIQEKDPKYRSISNSFVSCASSLQSDKTILIHLLDSDISNEATPIEEILEIFVRINSGGLVLQKSDLLMSLLDIEWNNIQPELFRALERINKLSPFMITRDDLLKSLLLMNNSETRFDRLLQDKKKISSLADELPAHLENLINAWKKLTILLRDDCKIASERFLKGGHNSLLPFVIFLASKKKLFPGEKQKLVIALYTAIMSGVFSSAEARMGAFARKHCLNADEFPLTELAKTVYWQYGIENLDDLLARHLDLTLNIAHGGITLDNNPENLQRDHIFPRSTLIDKGVPQEKANHYANFHFLRDKDNQNKSNIAPHKWFSQSGYTKKDLKNHLLTEDLIQPGKFKEMIAARSKLIQKKALQLFNMTEAEFSALFAVEDE